MISSTEYSKQCIERAKNDLVSDEGREDLNEFLGKDKRKLNLETHSIWMVWNATEGFLKEQESIPDIITISYIEIQIRKYFNQEYIKAHAPSRYNHVMNKLTIIGLYDRIKRSDNRVEFFIPSPILDHGMLWFYKGNEYIAGGDRDMGLIYKPVGGRIGN